MKKIETAIINTLCYADVFDYPLKAKEIHQFLIAKKPTTFNSTAASISDLINQKRIFFQKPYYYLPKRKKIIKLRQERTLYSELKLTHAEEVSQKLQLIPTITGVFVTGALAMHNAHQHDDIDLMIITKPNKLWTTRALITLSLQILGIRRKPKAEKVNNLICTNMYLDETALKVPKNKQNLYTAHEVVQVKPLLNRNHVYERFLFANQWVNQHLPNFKCHSGLDPESIQKSNSLQHDNDNRNNFLEPLAYKLQFTYMKSKITNETISPHLAYFHPRKTSHDVLTQHQDRLKSLK